jgi:hypothetical protein
VYPVLTVSPYATLLLIRSMDTLCREENTDPRLGWELLCLLDTLRKGGWWRDLSDADMDTLYEYHRMRSGFSDLLRPDGPVRIAPLRRRVAWSLWCAHLDDPVRD